MNVLVVICHPRRHSLTGALADAFIEGLTNPGMVSKLPIFMPRILIPE